MQTSFLSSQKSVKDLVFDLTSDSRTWIVIWEASGDDHKSVSMPHRDISFILGAISSEGYRTKKKKNRLEKE